MAKTWIYAASAAAIGGALIGGDCLGGGDGGRYPHARPGPRRSARAT